MQPSVSWSKFGLPSGAEVQFCRRGLFFLILVDMRWRKVELIDNIEYLRPDLVRVAFLRSSGDRCGVDLGILFIRMSARRPPGPGRGGTCSAA